MNDSRSYFLSRLIQTFPKIIRMIVYRDIISEDEVLSDAFKLSPVVDTDGATVRTSLYSLVRMAFFHLYRYAV